MKDNIVFLKEFISEFHNTGSCFPTSRWAASALCAPLFNRTKPLKILELGPGTGSVTVKILENLVPGDKLTICEINERFMNTLKMRLSTDKNYIKHKDGIDFFLGAMQDLPENENYDVIICALPFLNFELALVKDIFQKLKNLSTEKTILTYYEYIGIRSLRKRIGPKPSVERFKLLDNFFKSTYSKNETRRERVWLNFTPINIYTLNLSANNHY